MDFVQAIKSCLGQYATFSGRASRSEYWWFFLFQVLVMVATGMLGDVINGLASLALLLPALAVGTRRLHDIGRTGWWQLLLLTGIGFFVLLYWWVQPTDGASNSYGEPPAALREESPQAIRSAGFFYGALAAMPNGMCIGPRRQAARQAGSHLERTFDVRELVACQG